MPPLIDRSGERYGNLVVISVVRTKGQRPKWRCKCDCGKATEVDGRQLGSGRTSSCGCKRSKVGREINTRHGKHKTRLYKIWAGVVSRCENPSSNVFKYYGGRGIGICHEWRVSFEAFASAVGNPPSENHSLDRIDNEKGYVPGNVRWASRAQQSRNTRRNRMVKFKGERLCITDAAHKAGLRPSLVFTRLYRGWTESEALNTPKGQRRH